MKIKPVIFGHTNYTKEAVFRVWCDKYKQFERTLQKEELIENSFLCKDEQSNIFVSCIHKNGDRYYVDNVKGKYIEYVTDLHELYLIED